MIDLLAPLAPADLAAFYRRLADLTRAFHTQRAQEPLRGKFACPRWSFVSYGNFVPSSGIEKL